MSLSFNILTEGLPSCRVLKAPRKQLFFDSPCTDAVTYGDDLLKHAKDVLFIGTEERALWFLNENERGYALAIVGEGQALSAEGEKAPRLFAYASTQCFSDVVGACHLLFSKYARWESAMKTTLLRGGDYQSVLDCSAGMLSNFVSVSDSAFRLLAYTKGVSIDDPIVKSLVKKGYHDQKTIELFKQRGVFSKWKNQRGIDVAVDSVTSINESLSYIFRMQGKYFTHVVMHCNHRPISAGLIDVFQILINHLEFYAHTDWKSGTGENGAHQRLLMNLVFGYAKKTESTMEELRLSKVPANSAYMIYVFSPFPHQTRGDSYGQNYYIQRIRERFPDERALLADDKIIMFVFIGDGERAIEKIEPQIKSFLNYYGGICGASNQLEDIFDAHYGYLEACYALQRCSISGVIAELEEPEHEYLAHFKSYYSSFLISDEKNKELAAFCFEHSVAMSIYRDDAVYHTDNLAFLFLYLSLERKASLASEKMFIHRNSLLYRVNKLQTKYGVDFGNSSERICFMLDCIHLNLVQGTE